MTMENINERWKILSLEEIEERYKEDFTWVKNVEERTDTLTKINMAYDQSVKRLVIAKSTCYREKDINEGRIEERREYLRQQLNILNDISSMLLPEPLDWFKTVNDDFEGEYSISEPILILDYIPGTDLRSKIKEKVFIDEFGKVQVNRIIKLCRKILAFLKVLEEKGYGVVGLSDEHIIILNDDVPRFVGLSHICKMREGYLDIGHLNFERTIYGYSAPELNDYSSNARFNIKGRQVGAFSLGVLMHQMICSRNKFTSSDIKGGAFVYPNATTGDFIIDINNKSYKGKLLHMLITDLCRHEVTERLMDYDEIERRLMEIEESSDEDIYEMKPIRNGTIHIQRQNKKGFLDKLKEILGLN